MKVYSGQMKRCKFNCWYVSRKLWLL